MMIALQWRAPHTKAVNGGTLVITLSASGFTTPLGAANWMSQFSGNFNGSGTMELQTYLDTSDTLLGTGTLLSTLTSTGTPFGISNVTSASTNGSFALTEVMTISTNGAALISLDGSIAYVPEPASMALLGAGLIGTGVASRRRKAAWYNGHNKLQRRLRAPLFRACSAALGNYTATPRSLKAPKQPRPRGWGTRNPAERANPAV